MTQTKELIAEYRATAVAWIASKMIRRRRDGASQWVRADSDARVIRVVHGPGHGFVRGTPLARR